MSTMTEQQLFIEKQVLTQAGADIVTQAAEAEARARGVAPVIAVVDENGNLITLRRPDDAQCIIKRPDRE